ncbi:hydrolase, TatD family [Ancylostoma ceylanicum]|uniref:Hydrolase, TatD family n=1 Tax=Ancylostoma ceylanicum TaxID=53326 RepID=A0A0D6MBC6_9BILA|nr:hydrolase, TatD family [Ancylostoma ceylanicum]
MRSILEELLCQKVTNSTELLRRSYQKFGTSPAAREAGASAENYHFQRYPAERNWGPMASASELECNHNDLPSLEANDSMSEMSHSNSSETSDKTPKSRKKEKRDQPLYVPPNRRKSEDSLGKDGSHPALARLSTDSHDDESPTSRNKAVSKIKKKHNDDDLLPRPLAMKKKDGLKNFLGSPAGSSEIECQDTAISPATSSPMKNDRVAGRLNGRISYAERKEHTYDDVGIKFNFGVIQNEVDEYYIDSHCHLDFIYKKYSYGGLDCWLESEPGISHRKFLGCIPNFIEPSLFVKNGEKSPQYDFDWILEQLKSNYVLGATYGCHPHFADTFKDSIHETLVDLLQDRHKSKLLAIGECGLDYMKSDADSDVQVEVFRAQLALAKEYQVPLVIHCRSGPRGPGDAEKVCLSALNDVMSRQKTGRGDVGYISYFEGFTSAVANWEQSAPDKYEVLKRLPLRRMLLETDAPYFRPRQTWVLDRRTSVPMSDALGKDRPSLGLSRFHNIHRHCFTENWDIAQKWMDAFDNIYFGLFPVMGFIRNYDSAKTNNCDRFALPPMAVNVAFVIAKAKNMDVNQVIRETTQNALQMYCIRNDRHPS